ncbi:hypothetical protein [Streptomyces sp. GC420]|uniref:hypothetical protein n=1 Tax=Streptomyces sp. GC420 TaxID=2697568 RepID=UPI001414FBA1|nr:hypothetical protein [Streptomyces sp. GC420]NBM19343.1 hypothetical protein [Streptomyces sp. GC420]
MSGPAGGGAGGDVRQVLPGRADEPVSSGEAVTQATPCSRAELEQWEYEITSGGRVRYLVGPDTSTVILVYASPRHPKDTE